MEPPTRNARMLKFRNRETGEIYYRLCNAVDYTNDRAGTVVVCYHLKFDLANENQ